MRQPWTPTLTERVFIGAFFRLMTKTYGKTSRLVIEEGVRTMGLRGYLRYAGAATQTINKLQKELGEADAQLLIGLSSLFMGCGFCAHGHVLAGSLLWFRDQGVLHPLHPDSISELFEMTDSQIHRWLGEQLQDPPFQRLCGLAQRMLDIETGIAQGKQPDDHLLKLCLWIWHWTTECTIVEGVDMTPSKAFPIHPIGRDLDLRRRYDTARLAAHQ